MVRVSENSTQHTVRYALNRNKKRMEDLQLKGSTLRDISRPSDNPIANVEALSLQSSIKDNKQYLKNSDFALLNLNATEKAIEELVEILNSAKEIAIAQSSDFYDGNIRKNVSQEIRQLRNQAMAIANRRVGQRFLFGGYKSLEKPFDAQGKYNGDQGHTTLEVSKDFFVPINLHGEEVFFTTANSSGKKVDPFEEISPSDAVPEEIRNMNKKKEEEPKPAEANRDLASQRIPPQEQGFKKVNNIFTQLDTLINSLDNNDASLTQSVLEEFDDSTSRLITLRTKVGSLMNSVESAKMTNDRANIDKAARRSALVDSDIAELFSDITRHQNVLKTTYQASQGMMNQNLLDFLR